MAVAPWFYRETFTASAATSDTTDFDGCPDSFTKGVIRAGTGSNYYGTK